MGHKPRRNKLALACAVMITAMVRCAAVEVEKPEQAQEPDREVRTEMELKAALVEDDQIAAAPVRVEFNSGVVRLEGFVETEAEKQRAEQIARQTRPELEIDNRLQVWGAS